MSSSLKSYQAFKQIIALINIFGSKIIMNNNSILMHKKSKMYEEIGKENIIGFFFKWV